MTKWILKGLICRHEDESTKEESKRFWEKHKSFAVYNSEEKLTQCDETGKTGWCVKVRIS